MLRRVDLECARHASLGLGLDQHMAALDLGKTLPRQYTNRKATRQLSRE